MKRPVTRWLACRLMRHAADVLRHSRGEWAQAMTNEFGHVEDDFAALRWAIGCVTASYKERGGAKMDRQISSFRIMVKKPSAFVPLAMSVTAVAVLGAAYVVGFVSGHGGLTREPDEGAVAHIWQLLMAGQLPVLAFFAIKWLPRAPKQSLLVLALQVVAVIAAMAPVYLLHL